MSIVCGRPWRGLVVCAFAFVLGGCLDTRTDTRLKASVSDPAADKGAAISPRGAAVAFTSLEGPPPALSRRFAKDLVAEASGREITIADPKSARYFVRGYLTAYLAENGTAIAYVWDIFDSRHQRAQRVTDSVVVKGAAGDPWNAVDDAMLQSVAAKSADDLASFLAATPEAIAAAARPSANVAAVAAEPAVTAFAEPSSTSGKPLSYAPSE